MKTSIIILVMLSFIYIFNSCISSNPKIDIYNDSYQRLQASGEKILFLVNKSELENPDMKMKTFYDIVNENDFLKSNIELREFDGIFAQNFVKLFRKVPIIDRRIQYDADLIEPDLLKILLQDGFNYDNVYYITNGFLAIHRCYDDLPEGAEAQSSLDGYIVTPFTLEGPNECLRFSHEDPAQIINIILDHSIITKYSYEKLDKQNIHSQIKSISQEYFRQHPTWRHELKQLYQAADMYIDFDNNVPKYLIENFSRPKKLNLEDLILYKDTLMTIVEDSYEYRELIAWLDEKIQEITK